MFAAITIILLSIALIGFAIFAGIFGVIASVIAIFLAWVITRLSN